MTENERIIIGISNAQKKDGTKGYRYHLGQLADYDGILPTDTFFSKELIANVNDVVIISFGRYDGKYFIKDISKKTK